MDKVWQAARRISPQMIPPLKRNARHLTVNARRRNRRGDGRMHINRTTRPPSCAHWQSKTASLRNPQRRDVLSRIEPHTLLSEAGDELRMSCPQTRGVGRLAMNRMRQRNNSRCGGIWTLKIKPHHSHVEECRTRHVPLSEGREIFIFLHLYPLTFVGVPTYTIAEPMNPLILEFGYQPSLRHAGIQVSVGHSMRHTAHRGALAGVDLFSVIRSPAQGYQNHDALCPPLTRPLR